VQVELKEDTTERTVQLALEEAMDLSQDGCVMMVIMATATTTTITIIIIIPSRQKLE
jgi:hypothetical protein